MTQIDSVDECVTRLAIHRYVGMSPGPRHMHAIPDHARPFLAAALQFRSRTQRTSAHHSLFAGCFGTPIRFDHVIRDADLDIPAVRHPHPTQDWHAAALCHHTTPFRPLKFSHPQASRPWPLHAPLR
ncbi:hypothetical protein ABT126_43000 [Streptomyces sp. NPDC002012]|uniref:hypothetical protein n=1 Tax=Streptomyces sp. NPDC002012 TaxID=3154532 RepID=UPI00332503F1